MAKDLPYFKFFCSEWNDGDITLESYKIQGLFINVCSYYWSNECDLSLIKLKKRFKHNLKEIDGLLSANIIKEDDGGIFINFLDEQLQARKGTSEKNSLAGKKSAEVRRLKKLNEKLTPVEITLNGNSTIKKREEKKREEVEIDWDRLREKFNIITNKKSKVVPEKAKKQILARLKDGYTKEDIITAIEHCFKDQFHIDNNHKHLTLEFISRPDKLERYVNTTPIVAPKKSGFAWD